MSRDGTRIWLARLYTALESPRVRAVGERLLCREQLHPACTYCLGVVPHALYKQSQMESNNHHNPPLPRGASTGRSTAHYWAAVAECGGLQVGRVALLRCDVGRGDQHGRAQRLGQRAHQNGHTRGMC